MASSKVHTLARPGFWARTGNLAGQGLAESIPKEAERLRLAQGLKELGQKKGQDPFETFSELITQPGITAQGIQTGGELLKQRAQGQALSQRNAAPPKPQTFPRNVPASVGSQGSEAPSLTQPESFAKAQEGYIPPTQNEILDEAGRNYNANPALYNNDPQKAIEMAEQSALRDEARANAFQKKHDNLSLIQDNVVNRLQSHSERLGVQIPANVFSKIEDKAIQATKPKEMGGEGLTEQQAMKKYGEELDGVSREYANIDSVGNWGITGVPAANTLRNMKSIQKNFEKRGDTENLAKQFISRNGLSPQMAYANAQPISSAPELNSEFQKIKPIDTQIAFKRGYHPIPVPKEYIQDQTLKVSKDLLPKLGKNGSPLAVAYELDKLGYDAGAWLDYAIENRDDLYKNQSDQLDLPMTTTWNDWWLSSWSGLDKGSK
jgi:hypothetical protein